MTIAVLMKTPSNRQSSPERAVMSALKNKTVEGFVAELASSSLPPRRRSAAALSGALGAAWLVSMVCRLTIGKKRV
ncbi:hypothetical protein MASR1M66_04230 [Aminivibrio sp.]